MIKENIKFPLYAKSTLILIGLFALVAILFIARGILWVSNYMNINPEKIHSWIEKSKTELTSTNIYALGHTLTNVDAGLIAILVVPVYVFLLMFYKPSPLLKLGL